MDDLDFFDTLYQGWTKTTGAEDTYWMPEEGKVYLSDEGYPLETPDTVWQVFSVDEHQNRLLVAEFEREDDAAWVTALHGCFSDLVRRLHQAVDEAERFECEKDDVICEMAELAVENNDLRERLKQYEPVLGEN